MTGSRQQAEERATIVEIWINCPDAQTADAVAEGLLADRLIASANRYPEIYSRYVWQGRAVQRREVPLLVKSRKALFDAVVAAARAIHPYETPSILAVDVTAANADYIDWVFAQTIDPPR